MMVAQLRTVRSMARTDRVIVVIALVVIIVAGLAIYGSQSTTPIPYSSTSAAPDGTLGLYRWLATLGYAPRQQTGDPLQTEGLRALVVLEPVRAFSGDEITAITRWVAGGGTLLLLEDSGDEGLPSAFHLHIRPLPLTGGPLGLSAGASPYGATPIQPLLVHPPLRGLSVSTTSAIYGDSPRVIPVLGNGGMRAPAASSSRVVAPDPANPILVYEQFGRGQVFAGTTPDVLTNGLIGTGDNRRLILNVLAGLPGGATVGFDESHLVVTTAAPATLNDVLTATGWGRALIYALLLVAAYLLLTGRRLGRPLQPLPERGRSLAEYVISMAGTFRRAGLRERVLALWQEDLRHHLAGATGLRGRDDAELVAAAARRGVLREDEQEEALAVLRRRERVSEAELVALCRRIAAISRQ